MLILKWIGIIVVVLLVGALIAGQLGLLQGKAPGDLGVHDGRLKPPSRTPNSVSTQAELYPDHPMRADAQIAPLPARGDAAATMVRLRGIVESMPGAQVVKSEPDYLYVQFTTRLMHYVDDAEFWFDPKTQTVQMRSASRVGRKDFGVNRQRIEDIRARW